MARVQERLIRKVSEAACIGKGMRVLDLGCGLGGPAMWLARRFGCRVFGVDPGVFQMRSIRDAMKEHSGTVAFRAVYGDAHFLPFRADSFDRAYSIESAFHFSDKGRFLGESSKALRRRGMLVVADIVQSGAGKGSWLSRRLGRALAAETFFDADAYKSAALKAGLMPAGSKDITEGVRKTLPLWRNAFFRNLPLLMRTYPILLMAKIGLALVVVPLVLPVMPFRYMLLVFRKENGLRNSRNFPRRAAGSKKRPVISSV
ncbi:MAG TPA: class I SAM-dependent methyltransferase, partial [bacterium]